MKKWLWMISMLLLVFTVSGCGTNQTSTSSAHEEKSKTLVFGFTPGPYIDQVKKGIEPHLKKKGYTIRYVEFNDIIQPNFALAEGSIDVNIFQHTAYLENFKKENKLDLTEVIKVPTAPMGVYSDKHDSLDDLKAGDKIAIPNDPPNIARALRILEHLGWVQLKPDYKPISVSERDIISRKVNFTFVEVEQAQLPRTIPDVDYALVNGNFILSSGRKLSSSLYLENPPFEYQNLVAVRTKDKDKPFVKDIMEAYKSPEFQKIIETDPSFEGFHRPNYFQQ
ncbi:MetQ/NlpA family ABC transporter substrate-binding protein [Anoxybacteroides rupiense]|uniref:MetQ/NlpA family ABC transporter substrate-binding protein n=1 Tax=Anoxybacteroides rupiense TaxID=311460 RepID=UPI001606DB8A|nr:MetQ/NlpA family ABC transporter substrate-binding protein [Anoxybacillus rupiensis]MBB3908128.1 D-methionine transport system substrate-binding protein [Anoxybacillus rupiensis]